VSYTNTLGAIDYPIYDRVMTGDLKVVVEFNGEVMHDLSSQLMRNGSLMGFVSQGVMAHIYRDTHEDKPAKGYDLETKVADLPNIECKSATRHGAKLAPSDMYGAKRKYDHERFLAETPTKDFVIADTDYAARTGTLRWIVKTGEDVAALGHSLTRNKVEKLFS
jgi:hypothetical protein